MRVVVVDADREAVGRVVRWLGSEVVAEAFADPVQALRYSGWHDIDAVVVDPDLPGLDGERLLRHLVHVHPHVRRILVPSGRASPRAVQFADLVLDRRSDVASLLQGDVVGHGGRSPAPV